MAKPFTSIPSEDPLSPLIGINIKNYNDIITIIRNENILEDLEKNEIVKRENSPAMRIELQEKLDDDNVTIDNQDNDINKKINECKSQAEISRLKSEIEVLKVTIQNMKLQLIVRI